VFQGKNKGVRRIPGKEVAGINSICEQTASDIENLIVGAWVFS
jgi:hypothetical protein